MLSPTSFSDRLITLGDRIFRMVSLSSLTDKLANYIVKTTPKAKVASCFDGKAVDNASFATRVASKLIDEKISYINIPCNFSDPQFNTEAKVNEIINQGIDTLIRPVRNIISSLKCLHHKQYKEYNLFLMSHSFSSELN